MEWGGGYKCPKIGMDADAKVATQVPYHKLDICDILASYMHWPRSTDEEGGKHTMKLWWRKENEKEREKNKTYTCLFTDVGCASRQR